MNEHLAVLQWYAGKKSSTKSEVFMMILNKLAIKTFNMLKQHHEKENGKIKFLTLHIEKW